jgi:hypothetical protein
MRFVTGYYLVQNLMQDDKASRRPAESRRRRPFRPPITKWVASVRPARAAAPVTQRAQPAQSTRIAA